MSITEQNAPSPAVLRARHACAYAGVSEATWRRLYLNGDGPPAIDLTDGCRGWLVSDIDAWLASRPKSRSTSARTVAMAAA